MKRYYSAKEVSEICNVERRRLAYLSSEGIVPFVQFSDRKKRLYNFHSMIIINVVQEYARKGVKIRTIKKSLIELKKVLGNGADLANSRISSDGNRMYLRKNDDTLESLSGDKQLSFVFDIEIFTNEVIQLLDPTNANRSKNKGIIKKRA